MAIFKMTLFLKNSCLNVRIFTAVFKTISLRLKKKERKEKPSTSQTVNDGCAHVVFSVTGEELTDILCGNFHDGGLNQVFCEDKRPFLQGIQQHRGGVRLFRGIHVFPGF